MSLAISIENVSKLYRLGTIDRSLLVQDFLRNTRRAWRNLRGDVAALEEDKRNFWALRDINFQIAEGDTVGIVGSNGAGKSTLLKLISRITAPTSGSIKIKGRIGSLLEVGTGFHPELSGRENVFLNGAILGMSRSEVSAKFDDIVAFSGLEQFIDTPVKRYSSGMHVRLAFAVAAFLEPEILVLDEILAVGDQNFQNKCTDRIQTLINDGRTILFVSHSAPLVEKICKRAVFLSKGRKVMEGPATEVLKEYTEAALKNQGAGKGQRLSQEWPDDSSAPGDSETRLLKVRVLDPADREVGVFPCSQGINVEITYRVLKHQVAPRPNIHVYGVLDTLLFLSYAIDPGALKAHGPGIMQSRIHIPADFLSPGGFLLGVGLTSFQPVCVHCFIKNAVSFQVMDDFSPASLRQGYGGHWPGLMRPRLASETKKIH